MEQDMYVGIERGYKVYLDETQRFYIQHPTKGRIAAISYPQLKSLITKAEKLKENQNHLLKKIGHKNYWMVWRYDFVGDGANTFSSPVWKKVRLLEKVGAGGAVEVISVLDGTTKFVHWGNIFDVDDAIIDQINRLFAEQWKASKVINALYTDHVYPNSVKKKYGLK